jgi:hypothetical protein
MLEGRLFELKARSFKPFNYIRRSALLQRKGPFLAKN